MAESTVRLRVLFLSVTLAVAGCAYGETDVASETPMFVERSRAVVVVPSPPAPVPRAAVMAVPVREVALPSPPAGYAVLRIAQPTGNISNSVVYITKSAPPNVLVGREFDYRITMTNLTDVVLEDVILSAKLPTNFAPTRSQPQAQIGGGRANWQAGQLGPRETKTFIVWGRATGTGEVTFCSDVTYRIAHQCLAIQAVKPDLKVATSGPEQVLVCDAMTYQIIVTNPGTGMAENVRVVESLPAGMKTLNGESKIEFDVGMLGPGMSRTFTVAAKANRPGRYTTSVTATADGGLAAQAAAATTVRQPMLAVNISAPARRYLGRTVTHSITVRNTGDGVARNAMLSLTASEAVGMIEAGQGGRIEQERVWWTFGAMAPGTSKTVTATFRSPAIGMVRTAAVARADCAESSAEAVTAVRGIPAILLECVDVADPIEVGAAETYIIRVTNQGSAEDTNIVIKCILPAQEQFVSAEAPTSETVRGNVITFAPLSRLAPKAQAVFKVNIRGRGTGDVRFKVVMNSDQIVAPVEETESTRIYK